MDNINILIVDDDINIGRFMKLKLSLQAKHFLIEIVESGRECLSYIQSNRVDCILSDYQMPGMNGMELLQTIRGGGNKIPFIFITGHGNEQLATDAFKSGADDYFTKEIGFAHFQRMINSIEQAVIRMESQRSKIKAESALLQEKDKLQSILENIGEGISIQDRAFKILYQNPAHIDIVGNHEGELCYTAYEHRDEICEGCPVAETFKDGAVHRTERTTTVNDQCIFVEVTASPVRDAEGNIIAGVEVVRNVTERRHAEEAIVRSKRMLSTILDAVQFGMVVVGMDHRVRQINRAALDIMGYESETEILGKICHKNICPNEVGNCPITDRNQQIDFSRRALLDKNGKVIPIIKSVSLITIDGEEALLETFFKTPVGDDKLTNP